MKKLLVVFALTGLLISCKDKKKDEPKPEEPTTTKTDNPAPTPTTDAPSTGGVPKFADAEVQKYVDDYTAFVTGYVEAYKSKDMSKISSLSTKASEWTTRSMDISKKLAANPDEATKFATYMTKLSTDMAEAAKAMVPGAK